MNHIESNPGSTDTAWPADGGASAWTSSDGRHGHMVGIPLHLQPQSVQDNTVTLDAPIRRGETVIDKITLRKPKSGELRGVSLTDLLQMDVNALCTVLPRISTPMVLKQEASDLDPADLVQIGTKVASFLLTKAALESVSPSA